MKEFFCRIGMGIGILGAVFLFSSFLDAIASFRTPVDLYDDDTDINKLSKINSIETDFDVSLGCFVEEETTTKRNGAVTNRKSDYFYAIPAYSGDETYWIAIKVSQGEMRTWEKITDETYDYLNGEDEYFGYTSIAKYGRLKKLDDKKYKYMVELFEELEWFDDDSQISKYVLPLYIDTFKPEAVRNMALFGFIGTVIGIFSLISYFAPSKKERKLEQGGQAQSSDSITIAGKDYPKNLFGYVDKYISQQQNEFAQQELCQITGISAEEAKEVLDNWSRIYR